MTGRLYTGTSGFAYPGWTPRFYPADLKPADRLAFYAARLDACELNNTFYRQPRPDQVAAWTGTVPADFRFVVKAQRGGSIGALRADPRPTLAWLLEPYRAFGNTLGSVLFRVPSPIRRDDDALDRLLAAWPPDLPVTFDFQDPSWEDDAVHDRLRAAGAALCITDLGGPGDPS
ncbi:MAG TPA: DUF72 domain-containing protein, partial [Candidatus Limnocylindrales bacterium]|nr:DUF72 domain-containing protein [Candidatus Limnocylindrales bacterium]